MSQLQPPPPYQPYAPTPPRLPLLVPLWRRWLSLWRNHRILALILAAAVVIVVASAILSGIVQGVQNGTAMPPPTTTTAPTAAAVQPTSAAPTTAPTQSTSAQGIPATHGKPQLGGPLSDFIGAYGQPNGNSTPPLFDFAEQQNINGLMITGLGASCPSAQCNAAQQIDNITVQSYDQSVGFPVSLAEAKCLAYAPTDAHFKQRFTYADGSGFDMVYTSASLAKAFPASEFSDGNGGTVTAGTFDISYLYASNKVGVGSCDIITGATQTQQ